VSEDHSQTTFSLLRGIWWHFSRRRRIQFGLLFVVMLACGVAELVSLGAVLPFLAVLTDPDRLWQRPLVQRLATSVGLMEASDLLVPSTIVFVTAVVVSSIVRLMNLWLNGRLAAVAGSDLSCEAYLRTLYQPYAFHVQRNSSTVITGLTTQIRHTVLALNALLQLITSAVVAVGLFTALLLIDAPVALAGAALFGSCYGVLAIATRRELRSNGLKITESSSLQLKALQEGLGAIRDVLLDGSQSTYLQVYSQADRPQRLFEAKNIFLVAFPRYAFETLGLIAIAFLGLLHTFWLGSSTAVIPILGSMALGAQRLLPSFQQIYSGWALLAGNKNAIQDVLEILDQALPPSATAVEPLSVQDNIRFERVKFCYDLGQSDVLHSLDLRINRGEHIGLIGSTGSGKSTTVDLLMGLLMPTAGRVLVDGLDLHDPAHPERLLAWRSAISHVPQSVYLADSSIAENIAFGVPFHLINQAQVHRAAEKAQIAEFIESNPKGYATFVGERGIRLSGGQRQRIGIARALYKQATMLFLDEATSALDNATEEAVMQAVDGLSRDLTIVIIAHRLSTVQRCDRILHLDHGRVVCDGPPSVVLSKLSSRSDMP